VCCDFVPLTVNVPDQFRQSLCNPAQDEEGRPGIITFQQGKDALRVVISPLLLKIPFVSADKRAEIADAEPVFKIERKGVYHNLLMIP